MVFNKCCCCIDLRTGCIIIGILQIIGGPGNLSQSVNWASIIGAIASVIAGACLLFGSIKYNPIGVLINLVSTAISSLFLLILAILVFVLLGYSDAALRQVGLNKTTVAALGVAYLLVFAFNIYIWLCVWSFYKKLKSGDITSPA